MRPLFFDQPIECVSFGVACAIWYVPELIGTFEHKTRKGYAAIRGSPPLRRGSWASGRADATPGCLAVISEGLHKTPPATPGPAASHRARLMH